MLLDFEVPVVTLTTCFHIAGQSESTVGNLPCSTDVLVSVDVPPEHAEPVELPLPAETRAASVLISDDGSPTKIRKGVPVWYKGKVSPAFECHLFWPSPPKKKSKKVPTELFPACCSTSEWRELHRRKQKKSVPDTQLELNKTRQRKTRGPSTGRRISTSVTNIPDQPSNSTMSVGVDTEITEANRPTVLQAADNTPPKTSKKSLRKVQLSSKKKSESVRNKLPDKGTKQNKKKVVNENVPGKQRMKYPCVECRVVFGDRLDPKKDDDWLVCPSCQKWIHESCFLCHDC